MKLKSIALFSGVAMAAMVSAATVNTATAADSGYENPFNGFYAGVHGGYGWGDSQIDYNGTYSYSASSDAEVCDNDANVGFCTPIPVAEGEGEFSGSRSLSSTGGVLGIQAGANFVMGGGILIGAEVSASWSGIAGNDSFTDGDASISIEQSLDAFGLAQGKLGWANDKFAIYGQGGLALGMLATSASIDGDFGPGAINFANLDMDDTVTGWTIGGAAEYMVTDSVSLGVSYNYIDFGSVSSSETINNEVPWLLGSVDVNAQIYTDVDLTVQVVKATLNYHF